MQDAAVTSDRTPGESAWRRAEPLARAFFAELRDRSEEDRALVLRALSEHLKLQHGEEDEGRQYAVAALKTWHRETGETAANAYSAWRQRQPTPHPYPAVRTIREQFGGWSKAKAIVLGVPEVDVLSRRLLSNGAAMSAVEVEAAIRLWANEWVGPLRQSDYMSWASLEAESATRRLERLPTTAEPVRRIWGTWAAMLVALGLGDRQAIGNAPAARRRTCQQYTSEELRCWLTEAAAEVGLPMSRASYNRWAEKRLRRCLATRDSRTPPAGEKYVHIHGTWARALNAAGLITNEEMSMYPTGDTYTSEQIATHVADAARCVDGPLTQRAYMRWRRERLATLAAAGERPSIPSDGLIRRRFAPTGGWNALLDAVRRAFPDAFDGRDESEAA